MRNCERLKAKPSAKDAIEVILPKAGGTPVLAHPIQIRGMGPEGSEEFYANADKLIGRLKKQGLKGLECFHPDHSEEQAGRRLKLRKNTICILRPDRIFMEMIMARINT